jgi:hypothetical protein
MSETFPVGIVAERRNSTNKWIDFSWNVVSVLTDIPPHADWTELRRGVDGVIYYAGSAAIEAHRIETANYRDNLNSGRPSLWVVLRPREEEPGVELALVTADPAEGEAMTEIGDLIVEAVPMPAEIASRLAAFVTKHHVERAFIKRARE